MTPRCRKIQFPTQQEAEDYIVYLRVKLGKKRVPRKMRVYFCDECKAFHFTRLMGPAIKESA